MPARYYLGLGLLGLLAAAAVAMIEPAPGYMDADYYFAGGMRLAGGHGFSEVVLWNYLDDPAALPHPSNAYWMPLASLLAWLGMAAVGRPDFAAARIGFCLVAACIPPVTAALAQAITGRPALALTSGMFAAFSGYYAPFLSTTDTFGLYMLLGGAFFLVAGGARSPARSVALGLIVGGMQLARTDGLLWLPLALAAVYFQEAAPGVTDKLSARGFAAHACSLIGAYLVVMGPWYLRNLHVFGTALAPGGGRALWLTDYDQLFAYPPTLITMHAWLQAGPLEALKARLWAFGSNLESALAVQGLVFLFPFILIGIWKMRADLRIRIGILAWLATLGVMSLLFPFAGARGGFFHSGAALQPLWWVMAPAGIAAVVEFVARYRPWNAPRAESVFRACAVGIALVLTAALVWSRVVIAGWGGEARLYPRIESKLIEAGAAPGQAVIVGNPPGYFAFTGRPAVAVPDGDVNTVRSVAARFGARYMILEPGGVPAGLLPVFDAGPALSSLRYLDEVDGSRIFEIP